MLYIFLGITILCALLGVTEIIVRVWEKAERAVRRSACQPSASPAENIVRLELPVCLPDRDSVKNIYSLSDQFADRFREVVNS